MSLMIIFKCPQQDLADRLFLQWATKHQIEGLISNLKNHKKIIALKDTAASQGTIGLTNTYFNQIMKFKTLPRTRCENTIMKGRMWA